MLRKLLRKYGVAFTTLLLTLAIIFLSILITSLLVHLLSGEVRAESIIVAVLAPAIVAPVFIVYCLNLVAELESVHTQLHQLAITDDLTKVYNRRYLLNLAQQELERLAQWGGALSIAIVDIDEFKAMNDKYGHLGGDVILREFTEICSNHIRKTDTLARFGGDEFIIFCPNTEQEQMEEVVGRVRMALAETEIPINDETVKLTISAGITTTSHPQADLVAILNQADNALYNAKKQGGDRVIVG